MSMEDKPVNNNTELLNEESKAFRKQVDLDIEEQREKGKFVGKINLIWVKNAQGQLQAVRGYDTSGRCVFLKEKDADLLEKPKEGGGGARSADPIPGYDEGFGHFNELF